MKILLDTNILISASKNKNGNPFKTLIKASSFPNHLVLCQQNIIELKSVYNRKFSEEMHILESFLSSIFPVVTIIPTPATELNEENKIRDVKDRPILRAAVISGVDIIVTGDKDFLEAGLTKPKIMTPAEFANL